MERRKWGQLSIRPERAIAQYRRKNGNHGGRSVWCDHELYVWSWFAGRSGNWNDKKLLSFSPLFIDILSGGLKMFLAMAYILLSGEIRGV